MSRCYPFPPPGYEKKNRIDDVDVLAKERHKEKKHKKDKDRERKDGKVKKDKDRSKGKSKEKKDHRDKHKHKKDRKEKSKNNEKNHGTLNKKPEVHLTSVDGVRVNPNALQTVNHNSGNSNHVEELARRIRVDEQATGSQIVPKNTTADEGKVNGTMNSNNLLVLAKRMVEKEINSLGGPILQKVRLVDQAKVHIDRRTNGRNGCFSPEPDQIGNSRQVDASMVHCTMEFGHLQGLAKRTMEKEKNGLEVQIVQKIRVMDQAKDDGTDCYIPEPNGKEMGTRVNGRVVNGTMDVSHLQVSAKRNLVNEKNGLGGHIVEKVRLVDQAKVQMHTRSGGGNDCCVSEPNGKDKCTQVDYRTFNGGRNFEEAMNISNVGAYVGISKSSKSKDVRVDSEGTDKSKHDRESSYKMDKHESKDRGNKSELKNKVRDKERKTEEKLKENGELSNRQSKAIKGGSEQNHICSVKKNGQSKAVAGNIQAGAGGLGKRKELEINGFLHENGTRPHKLQRPIASSPKTLENGRKSEACQIGERKTEAQHRKVSPKSPLPITMEASIRQPHPDSMLLSQILSLPELDRTPGFDDQEWLFCNTSHRESLKICESGSSERQMVWNHGTRIESADIFALPYVVPY